MPITYYKNYFRAGADRPRFMLPGDTARAAINDFDVYEQDDFRKVTYAQIGFIDNAIARLTRVIARKGFDIPGVDVDMDVLGKDDKPVHHIDRISGGSPGGKWSIRLNRPTYSFNNRNVYAGASKIIVPGHELEMYEDGHVFYTGYVGNDWASDEDYFHTANKCESKKNGEPRRYLNYNFKDTVFRHTNDNGDEYDPNENEPRELNTIELLCNFASFIDELTDHYKQLPDVDTNPYQVWENLARVKPKKLHCPIEPFYVCTPLFGAAPQEGIIIPAGGDTVFAKTPQEFNLFPPSGRIGKSYHFGFTVAPYQSQSGLWGSDPAGQGISTVKVDLKYANDIYVVDEIPLMEASKYVATLDSDANNGIVSEDDKYEMYAIMEKMIVPLSKYEGGFARPMYLINRPLWDDEATDVTADVRGLAQPITDSNDDNYCKRLFGAMGYYLK